jgi:beta-glucosidase
MTTGPRPFPPGFLWGVSTAAHQVEGGNTNNQWHEWEQAGRIKSGDNVGLACDWWRDAEPDLDRAQQLGINALRVSIEWSRVEPLPGVFDDEALLRYREILIGIRQRGMRPWVCLHHFTHPIWLERRGGFLDPAAPRMFADFAHCVVTALGDLCTDWVTFNEPNVYVSLGYVLGAFPPGFQGKLLDAARVTVNLCRAHAAAYHLIHGIQKQANVGWAQHVMTFAPGDPQSAADRLLCRVHEVTFNQNFLESLVTGKAPFPLSLRALRLPEVVGTFDYLGVNYYSRMHLTFDRAHRERLFVRHYVPDHLLQGDQGVEHPYGEFYPDGLYEALRLAGQCKKPIYVLENGIPDRTDSLRPTVLQNAVHQMQRALSERIDLRGYFHWTLVDNFEWNEGWHLRFGLFALDPETQIRRARPSAKVFADIIRASHTSQLSLREEIRVP